MESWVAGNLAHCTAGFAAIGLAQRCVDKNEARWNIRNTQDIGDRARLNWLGFMFCAHCKSIVPELDAVTYRTQGPVSNLDHRRDWQITSRPS